MANLAIAERSVAKCPNALAIEFRAALEWEHGATARRFRWVFRSDRQEATNRAVGDEISAESGSCHNRCRMINKFLPPGDWLTGIVSSSHVAIGISRMADGRFVAVNEAFAQMYGIRREDVVGRTSLELALWEAPEDRARLIEAIRRGDAVCAFEARYRKRSGEIGDLAISANIVTVGGEEYLIGMLTDISERKRMERETQLNQRRLDTVLLLSDLLVFHQDRALRYTWVANPALGAGANELLGRNDADILGAVGARPLIKIKRRVLRTGKWERHEVCLARGEHRGCFDVIVAPEYAPDGTISGIVCAAADISRRKQAEEARDAALRVIGSLVDHVQDEIEAQRRELAREVHDEIGAVLTGLRMKLGAPADDDRREQTRALRALVDQALARTRTLCTRLRPPVLDDLGLSEALRWYVREWGLQTGIRITVRIATLDPEPDEPLRTDLFRMLQELLTNVARHAGAGKVVVSLTRSAGQIRLRVSDDGGGFAAYRKTGFGLLGIRERLRRHGGELNIAHPVRGVRVTLTVPEPTA